MEPGLPGLSDDELEIIFERLCRPLDPSPAVALSAASRSMRAPVEAALGRLRRRHEQAKALLAKAELYIEGVLCPGSPSCTQALSATGLHIDGLTVSEWEALGALALVGEMPQLTLLVAGTHRSSDGIVYDNGVGVQRFLAALPAAALPAVDFLNLSFTGMDEQGAASFAAALGRGALPKLGELILSCNPIKDAGLAALAPQLRQRPAFFDLRLDKCQIGDDGLAALVAPPYASVFPTLTFLDLRDNPFTDAGCATLAGAIRGGALPAIKESGVFA